MTSAPAGAATTVDHALVQRTRRAVGEKIAEYQRTSGARPDPALVTQLIMDELLRSNSELVSAGRLPLSPLALQPTVDAVRASLFGAGRLQPLLDDPLIENIDADGCDRVFVSRAGSPYPQPAAPIAESDEALITEIRALAAYAAATSRPWDEANPELDLQLPDGSRLSALMSVSRRPQISIRRSRHAEVHLSDLVANGSLLPETAAFLRAAVLARKNLIVAGATNAGKTTLLRALINEIPAHERLITIENARELGVDQSPQLHPNAVSLEARLPNSEGAGAVAMRRLVRRSLRMNPDRVIVGEVLGDEIVDMLNAMSQGNDGSLSTIHANAAGEVFSRIATYALQAPEHLAEATVARMIAGALHFVVFLSKASDSTGLRRQVTSIREVNGLDGQVLSSEVFAPGPDGRAVPAHQISCLPDLIAAGYQPLAGSRR